MTTPNSMNASDFVMTPESQTLSVLVENKPGVLTRVAALFARRAFNIHSLAVGPTEHPDVSRITVVVIGVVSIILGILAMDQNVAFLVSLAFAIAASANLPTILYSLYWKRFNTTGAVASMYTGLGSALILIFFSPAVSGAPSSMISGADWSFFPLTSPGLISIPLAFLAGWIGTMIGKPDNMDALQAEMEVRSLTGVGVEAPVDH